MSDEARVAELRKLFPVVDQWAYLYNGSIHPGPSPVGDAMRSLLDLWHNGGENAYGAGAEAFERLREKYANLIGARAANIVITESTTAGLNLAGQILQPGPEQNVVMTDLAFMSNTYMWLARQPASPQVRFVENRHGKIAMDDLAAAIDDQTAAVSISAVTAGSGFRYDLQQVHAITRRRDVPLIVDGAQAVGLVDLNVTQPPLDFMACTASKWLMGPAGVGFLYVADRYLDATPPAAGWFAAANVSDWDVRNCRLHDDAKRFQGGIPNLVGVVGALAGIELIEQVGRPFIERRVRELTTYAMQELEEMGVALWTPRADNERAGIVFFRTAEYAQLHAQLKKSGVYCGSFLGGIRIDPNFYNTFEEIDRFLAIVRSHVAKHPN